VPIPSSCSRLCRRRGLGDGELVKDEGHVGLCDELIVLSHDEVAGAASDVDAVTGVGGGAEDTLVAS
jgi:hypothetical protein